jgi:3-hydroxymyristoyl/3-hydroxydecanoyl-(acyl carrier protein) dehydratase
MSGRFRAFSFVDRILAHDPALTVQGRYAIPAHATRFPASLAAEAVGQLAAWAAMNALDFRVRPVAGLAGETRFGAPFRPGDTLDLEVTMESATPSDVAYHGRALVGGEVALVLDHALGPMLPAEEFDDPDAMRADFRTLSTTGAPAGRFGGVDAPRIDVGERDAGKLRATLAIPHEAAYFADHFPRKPVFPATLLMDAMGTLAAQAAGVGARVVGTQDVKVRQFMPPGETLAIAVDVDDDGDGDTARVVAKMQGRPAATARVLLARER